MQLDNACDQLKVANLMDSVDVGWLENVTEDVKPEEWHWCLKEELKENHVEKEEEEGANHWDQNSLVYFASTGGFLCQSSTA